MKNIDEIKKAHKLENNILNKHYLLATLKKGISYGTMIGLAIFFWGPSIITTSIWLKILYVIGAYDFISLGGSYLNKHRELSNDFLKKIDNYLEIEYTGNEDTTEEEITMTKEYERKEGQLKFNHEMTIEEKIEFLESEKEKLLSQQNSTQYNSRIDQYIKRKH